MVNIRSRKSKELVVSHKSKWIKYANEFEELFVEL